MRTWTIDDDHFRELLRRAHEGEDPDVMLLEEMANGHIVFETGASE